MKFTHKGIHSFDKNCSDDHVDQHRKYDTKYEIFIASGTNIKYMETTCNKDMENDKQN